MSVCSPALRERPAPAGLRTKGSRGTCLGTRLGDICRVYRQENEQGITLKITLMRHIFIWKAGRSSRQGDKRNRSRRAPARGPLLYKGLGIGVFFAAPRAAGGEIRRKAHCKPAAPNKPETLYKAAGATLDDLREAVTTLEDAKPIARRVLGGAHPTTKNIEEGLRIARAALRARETPGSA